MPPHNERTAWTRIVDLHNMAFCLEDTCSLSLGTSATGDLFGESHAVMYDAALEADGELLAATPGTFNPMPMSRERYNGSTSTCPLFTSNGNGCVTLEQPGVYYVDFKLQLGDGNITDPLYDMPDVELSIEQNGQTVAREQRNAQTLGVAGPESFAGWITGATNDGSEFSTNTMITAQAGDIICPVFRYFARGSGTAKLTSSDVAFDHANSFQITYLGALR